MYRCKKCNSEFVFPEERNLDAGRGEDLFGRRTLKTARFCPECFSVNIEKKQSEKSRKTA